MRLNALVMPHARITKKATHVLTGDEYKKWLDGVLEVGLLQKQPAADAPKVKDKDDPPAAFGHDILFVAWDVEGKARQISSGNLDDEKKTKAFAAKYETALKDLKETYPAK